MCVVVPFDLFAMKVVISRRWEGSKIGGMGSIHIQMIMMCLFCSGLCTILCRVKDGCPP